MASHPSRTPTINMILQYALKHMYICKTKECPFGSAPVTSNDRNLRDVDMYSHLLVYSPLQLECEERNKIPTQGVT